MPCTYHVSNFFLNHLNQKLLENQLCNTYNQMWKDIRHLYQKSFVWNINHMYKDQASEMLGICTKNQARAQRFMYRIIPVVICFCVHSYNIKICFFIIGALIIGCASLSLVTRPKLPLWSRVGTTLLRLRLTCFCLTLLLT